MNTIVESFADRFRRCLPRFAPEFRADTPLEELALDSIDTVELLCSIHEEFGVRLTEDDITPPQTVGGLMAIIERRATR